MKKEFIIQELESLIRSLDFIQEEQAFIKRKLSGLLENLVLNDFIIWAEDLQLQILNREAALRLLKNDILLLKKGVKASKSSNNMVEPKFVTPQAEGLQALIWHLIISHPLLAASVAKWEGLDKETKK